LGGYPERQIRASRVPFFGYSAAVNRSDPRLLRLSLWALFFAWMGLIAHLSSLPSESVPGGWFPNFDKLLHAGAFGCGTLLLLGALHTSTRWADHRIAAIAVLAVAIFGITDEWHQLSTPNRSGADPADLAADVAGAVLAAYAFHYVRSKRRGNPAANRTSVAGD
jgi:hypothetical protein